MIAAQQDGLMRQIQEGGRGLSGGQRSLVGINRLLLADPTVWLLDEPTASLDQTTESAVLEAIDRQLGEDTTLVMVTHKPQLLSRFTRIIVMAGGKVVARWTGAGSAARSAAQAAGGAVQQAGATMRQAHRCARDGQPPAGARRKPRERQRSDDPGP